MLFQYETDRLLFKILKPSAAKDVLSFYERNKTVFEPVEPVRPEHFYTPDYQKNVLYCEYQLALRQTSVRYYIFPKSAPDTIIGTICFRDITKTIYQCCEIGYKFDRQYWNKGYAFEALEKSCDILFKEWHLHRITARVMPNNLASIHLLEKIGFQKEGLEKEALLINGRWEDHFLYALLRSASESAPSQYIP